MPLDSVGALDVTFHLGALPAFLYAALATITERFIMIQTNVLALAAVHHGGASSLVEWWTGGCGRFFSRFRAPESANPFIWD